MENSAERILIVEDDMIISTVLERMVTKMNYNIIDTTRSGKEAIELATTKLPGLILMDIQLIDDIDGIEAMERIKKVADIPVIYITGNSDSCNRERAEKTGYHDYMTKPISIDDLEKSIAEAFAENDYSY
ncbi:MAG: response regulator [Balneolaceae bacterium]|nr:response regulator [Balneolaceae bacterium]